MEDAKLANGSEHKLPGGHIQSKALRAGERTARKKADREKAKSARNSGRR